MTTTIVRWKNTFRIEVNGTEGYGVLEGRGKNYGVQEYRRGLRWGWLSGKPQGETEELVVTDLCVDSFYKETKSLLFHGSDNCDGVSALDVMELYSKSLKVMK